MAKRTRAFLASRGLGSAPQDNAHELTTPAWIAAR